MRALLQAEGAVILAFAGLAVLGTLMTGQGVQVLWLILTGYVLWHLWWAGRFYRAMQHHQPDDTETLPGLWRHLGTEVVRANRRADKKLQRLRAQRDQAVARLEHLPIAVVELTDNFHIQWLNPAATHLLGVQRHDRGRDVRQLIRLPEFVHWLERGDFSGSLKLALPGPRLRVLQVQLRPFDSGWLMLAEDVSSVHDLIQMRRDFVANASHELRTPLTVFTGYLEALHDMLPREMETLRPALTQMAQQAERMRRIIDDLLTLSTVERQQTLSREVPVDMTEMMAVLKTEAELLSAGRHRIQLHCDATLPLCGDPELLRSVFTNLLSNAVRYTPQGGQIVIRWWQDAQGGHFEVQDTGIGIAREHIPRLTERFYRVDMARSRETGGTGLGLAIVKHVLELHGGHLHVDSLPQVGSTFRCDFPPQRLGCHESVTDASHSRQTSLS